MNTSGHKQSLPWHVLYRIVCGLLAVPGLLIGCADRAAEDGRVEVTYWRTLTGGAGEAQEELVARFNESQDRIRVEAQFQGGYGDLATKLMTASVAKSGPDVTQLGTFEIRQFAKAGVLADLRPYIEGPNGIETAGWPETLIRAGEVDGGTYWLPFNVTVPILYYNPAAFAEAGIDEPPETWDAFYDVARRLTKRDERGRVVRHGLALWNITWPLVSAIWSEGGELTTRDYSDITLDDPVAVAVLSAFQALVREGAAILPERASGGHRAAFTSGRAAIILDSPAPFDEIMESATGFDPAVALYPSGAAGRVYAPGGGGIALIAHAPAERREAAWDFVRFLLEPEQIAYYAERSGYTALTEKAQEAAAEWIEEPARQMIHSALHYVRGDFSVTMSPGLRLAFDQAYQRIMVRLDDVEEALRDADRQAEKAVAKELADR